MGLTGQANPLQMLQGGMQTVDMSFEYNPCQAEKLFEKDCKSLKV